MPPGPAELTTAADDLGVPPLPSIANRLPYADVLSVLGLRPNRPRGAAAQAATAGGPVTSGELGKGPGAGFAGKGELGGHNQTGGLIVG